MLVTLSSLAFNTSALSGKALSEERKTNFLSNINLQFYTERDEKIAIEYFGVSDSGDIAILCEEGPFGGTKKYVHILDSNGIFKYGYSFKSYGSVYAGFDGDILILFFVREDIVVWLNDKGECVKAEKIDSNADNNRKSINNMQSLVLEKDGIRYRLESENLISSILVSKYSRIAKQVPGEEPSTVRNVLIYKADEALGKSTKSVVTFYIILVIAVVVIFGVFLAVFIPIRKKIKAQINIPGL